MPKGRKDAESKDVPGGIHVDLGLGNLFEGLGDLIKLVSEVAEKGGQITQTGEIKGLGEGAKGIFGLTIKTLADGEPQVLSFGNIRQTEEGTVVVEAREPLVDIFEEGNEVRVVAELPGAEEKDIHYEVEGDILTISSDEGRTFSKEVLLPWEADPQSLEASYKNGILELKLSKAEPTESSEDE